MSWQRVRGHDALVEAFDRARKRGRLAHAYLFTGPPGVGKKLFATELAKALLCENPPGQRLEACDRCPGCVQVEAGTHPDFFQVGLPEDKHEWPIELMRELLRGFGLKSARGKGKVAILDDADEFNEETANAFLKTLEEPPPGSVLILIGTRPDLQLPTIVSRCQVVRFAPLPQAVVAELLRDQRHEATMDRIGGGPQDVGAHLQGVQDEDIERLARLSGGSLGQAQALAEPALWDFRRKLLQGLARPQPDTVALSRDWMRFVEEAGKESALHRRRAALGVSLLIDALNDALRLRLGAPSLTAEPDEVPLLEQLAQRADPDKLIDLLERCLEGDRQIDRRVQLVLVLEGLLDALGQKLR